MLIKAYLNSILLLIFAVFLLFSGLLSGCLE